MNRTVTSVSKSSQLFVDSAAAVFVISAEDIRRSGTTLLPEVLRLAPGLHVARISSNQWAITARGFNGRFSNKLLVLVDGRTVYTPIFSGVYWEGAGPPARRHRAYRDHSWPGREPVGLERGQWRHQHHSQDSCEHARQPGRRRRRRARGSRGRLALRRAGCRENRFSPLQPLRHTRWPARRERWRCRGRLVRASWRIPGRLAGVEQRFRHHRGGSVSARRGKGASRCRQAPAKRRVCSTGAISQG